MAGIDEKKLATIEKKMGMIGVIHKDGYLEERVTILDLVRAHRRALRRVEAYRELLEGWRGRLDCGKQ